MVGLGRLGMVVTGAALLRGSGMARAPMGATVVVGASKLECLP
jgi:hypothetical protein